MSEYTIIQREINADTETPISLYYKLAKEKPYSFLLESANHDERTGRFSFMGINPLEVLTFDGRQNPLEKIKRRMQEIKIKNFDAHHRFQGGFVGYFTYETIRFFENIQVTRDAKQRIPDGIFMFPQIIIAFDHYEQTLTLNN